nr:MAG TPA: hypothetical protein [Caudoviricetes sp.]DAS16951.1 MAG TPA: hypothetical protein [Caudoviricetes sp.]
MSYRLNLVYNQRGKEIYLRVVLFYFPFNF